MLVQWSKNRNQWTYGSINKKRIRLYNIWRNIIFRCFYPKNGNYLRYGFKGIFIDKEWYNYFNFEKWALQNGYKNNLTIDRIDNLKNYCKENCRWVDYKIQERNKSNNKLKISHIKKIKELRKKGLLYREIGTQFNVSRQMISLIVRKLRWC